MPGLIIIFLIIGYCGYFTFIRINYNSKNHKLYSKNGFCRDIKKLNILHITGIFLLGFPLIFLNKQTALILCLVTTWFHSILPALLIHTTLLVSHEGYILKHFSLPNINFKP